MRADGSVIAWGDNSYGQSAVPASATNVVSIAAGYYHNLALRADGTVIAWGKGYLGVTNVPSGLTNVVMISAGEDHSLAFVCSGSPQFGRQPGPIMGHVGSSATLAVNVVGAYPLTCQWFHDGVAIAGATNRSLVLTNASTGDAGNYVLTATNAAGQATSLPVHLEVNQGPALAFVGAWGDDVAKQCTGSAAATAPCAIAAGAFHGLALNTDGSVVAWGKNSDARTNVPPTATNVVAIAAGGAHSLALRDDGSVIAWGRNWDGQINVPPTATNVVAVAAGCIHSLASKYWQQGHSFKFVLDMQAGL